MFNHAFTLLAVISLSLWTDSATAQETGGQKKGSSLLSGLVRCQALTDNVQRLACYDREVASLDRAQRAGDVVAFDRTEVRRTRRSLFGLALPNLGIFGDDTDQDGSSEIVTTIRSARASPSGKWVFDLAEGGRWEQLDSREFIVDPAPGQTIRIRRAAMGSYLANVNKQIAVRVRRIN